MNFFEYCSNLINDILAESKTTRHNTRLKKAKQKVQSFIDRQKNLQNYLKQGIPYEKALKKAKIGSKTEEPKKVEGGYIWENPNSGVAYKVEVKNKTIEPNKKDNVINFEREQIAKRINEILPTANVRQTADGKNIIGDPKEVKEIMDLKKRLKELDESFISERTYKEVENRAKEMLNAAKERLHVNNEIKPLPQQQVTHGRNAQRILNRILKGDASQEEIENAMKEVTHQGAKANKNLKVYKDKIAKQEEDRKNKELLGDITYGIGNTSKFIKTAKEYFNNLINSKDYKEADESTRKNLVKDLKDKIHKEYNDKTQSNREQGYKKSAQSNQKKKTFEDQINLENKIKNTVLANAAAQADKTGKSVFTEFGMKNPIKFKKDK